MSDQDQLIAYAVYDYHRRLKGFKQGLINCKNWKSSKGYKFSCRPTRIIECLEKIIAEMEKMEVPPPAPISKGGFV